MLWGPVTARAAPSARLYGCMCGCMYVCMYGCLYVCLYVCMYVGMYVFMYVCMYVCIYLYMSTVAGVIFSVKLLIEVLCPPQLSDIANIIMPFWFSFAVQLSLIVFITKHFHHSFIFRCVIDPKP